MSSKADTIVCIGGATVDRKYRAIANIRPETSNPVTSERSFGGVARNVAENLARLGARTSLVSVLGDDENGQAVLENLRRIGIDTQHMAYSSKLATAEYVAVLQPGGDLAFGLADMAIFDDLTPALLHKALDELSSAWVFADCNLPPETLLDLIDAARRKPLMLALDAVSTPKVMRLPQDLTGVGLLFLNRDEAEALLEYTGGSPVEAARALQGRGVEGVVLTLGDAGLVAADGSEIVEIQAVPAQVVDATGAGDALIAATLMAMLSGRSLSDAVRLGTAAAALTVECQASVRPDLSPELLEATLSLRAQGRLEREPL
jgi:pseudouridine kinase